MTCFQAAYNYLDLLGEQPCADPDRQRQAPAPERCSSRSTRTPDTWTTTSISPQHEDGGYLREILDACRAALATLPSYAAARAGGAAGG